MATDNEASLRKQILEMATRNNEAALRREAIAQRIGQIKRERASLIGDAAVMKSPSAIKQDSALRAEYDDLQAEDHDLAQGMSIIVAEQQLAESELLEFLMRNLCGKVGNAEKAIVGVLQKIKTLLDEAAAVALLDADAAAELDALAGSVFGSLTLQNDEPVGIGYYVRTAWSEAVSAAVRSALAGGQPGLINLNEVRRLAETALMEELPHRRVRITERLEDARRAAEQAPTPADEVARQTVRRAAAR